MTTQEILIEKINALPPTKLSVVADFVESIAARSSDEEEESLIAEYAAEFGGTEFDLDLELEQAGLECLQKMYEADELDGATSSSQISFLGQVRNNRAEGRS